LQNLIIGTIGHIDHGKTALVRELTGFDGDNTKQEKQRGITIDISFSHLCQKQKRITFIDVPGHEDLVKNMIAGAFSLDTVLCIVAANEGIKPQTKEHLQICKLLGLKHFIVVLTKCDLVSDEEIFVRKHELDLLFESLHLRYEEIMPCSIYNANSIEGLKTMLFGLEKEVKNDYGFFRYYVDRVFSVKGSGTVVTGTVISGEAKCKDKLFLCETQQSVQVKAIEAQNEQVQSAPVATRAAINLSGIGADEIERGMQLSNKGFLRGFKTVDAVIYKIDKNVTLHDREFTFFSGAKRLQAKVLELHGTDEYSFVTLVFAQSLYSLYKDKFILRSDNRTVGGGEILNPIADPMKKAQKIALMQYLLKDDFYNAFMLLTKVHKKGFGLISSLQRFGLTHEQSIAPLLDLQELFVDSEGLVVYPLQSVRFLQRQIENIFEKNPYALISAKFISQRFNWVSIALAQYVLDELELKKIVMLTNGLYMKTGAKVQEIRSFNEKRIYQILESAKLTPQAPYNIYDMLDLDRKSGDTAMKKLCNDQKVRRLAHNYFITTQSLDQAKDLMKEVIKKEGYIDIQNFKNYLPVSRKYLIALLEYLDTMPYIKTLDNKRVFQ
jgi:selenocysteine-specific elongation factor